MTIGKMSESNLWLKWVIANMVGLGAGMALFAAVAEGIEQSGVLGAGELGDIIGHLIGLPLAGALFGLMQWLVLRRYILRTGFAESAGRRYHSVQRGRRRSPEITVARVASTRFSTALLQLCSLSHVACLMSQDDAACDL